MHSTQSITSLMGVHWEILVFYLDDRVFKLLINGCGGRGGGMVKLISGFISTSFSSFSQSPLRARGEDHALEGWFY